MIPFPLVAASDDIRGIKPFLASEPNWPLIAFFALLGLVALGYALSMALRPKKRPSAPRPPPPAPAPPAPYNEFSQEEINSHITTHCTANVVLSNLCIPYMQKGSHIINMASQSAFQPVPYINLYAASKAFVRSYSRALNVELKGKGIVSTVACPGWIKTELLELERNGKQIYFPAIALPEDVAKKTLKDAQKGKDMSVYGTYVKYMHLLAKIFPHILVMRTWL